MSDEDDSWEEGDALDVVLSLDQDPLEVKQYEATDFEVRRTRKNWISWNHHLLRCTIL